VADPDSLFPDRMILGILLNPDPALPNPEPVQIQIQTNVCMANNSENFTAEKNFDQNAIYFSLKL
jgi:hypothetical protein